MKNVKIVYKLTEITFSLYCLNSIISGLLFSSNSRQLTELQCFCNPYSLICTVQFQQQHRATVFFFIETIASATMYCCIAHHSIDQLNQSNFTRIVDKKLKTLLFLVILKADCYRSRQWPLVHLEIKTEYVMWKYGYIENNVCTRVTNCFSAHERVIFVSQLGK